MPTASLPDAEPAAPHGGRAARAVWLVAGLVGLGLGGVGIVVPLMPTTIFVILAAGCFARSSPRLDAWLRTHPRFGPPIRAWQAERAIPARAKRAACMGIALGYGLFWLGARPHWPLALTVAVMMGGCALWIVTRPLPSAAGLP